MHNITNEREILPNIYKAVSEADPFELIKEYEDTTSDDEQQLAIRITDAIEMADVSREELFEFMINFNKWMRNKR